MHKANVMSGRFIVIIDSKNIDTSMDILSESDNSQARIEIHACSIDRDYFTKQRTDYLKPQIQVSDY